MSSFASFSVGLKYSSVCFIIIHIGLFVKWTLHYFSELPGCFFGVEGCLATMSGGDQVAGHGAGLRIDLRPFAEVELNGVFAMSAIEGDGDRVARMMPLQG